MTEGPSRLPQGLPTWATPSVAALARLRAGREDEAAAGDLQAGLGQLPDGDGTVQLEPVSTGSLAQGDRGVDGVRYTGEPRPWSRSPASTYCD